MELGYNERLELIIATITEGIVGTDISGRCTFANAAFCSLMGYDFKTEIEGRLIHTILQERLADGTILPEGRRTIDMVFATGVACPAVEEYFMRKDGTFFPVEYRTIPMNLDGKPAGLVVVVKDITAEVAARQVKESLERQVAKDQQLKALGTLAGGIAHDFNNILMGIMGYAELVSMDIPRDTKTHKSLQGVLNGAYRARDLVKQILQFSHHSPGQGHENVCVSLIASEVYAFLRATTPSSVKFTSNIAENLWVYGDHARIYQVLINLCTNAMNAISPSGEVNFRVRTVTLGEDFAVSHPPLDPGEFVEMEVVDNGCGIPTENLTRIFDPYFTTRQSVGGNGFGLSIVHGVVVEHGGTIEVRSEVGKGSSFRVLMPATKSCQASVNGVVLDSGAKQSVRILFVDDELPILTAYARILAKAGYEVTTSHDPARALELFQKSPETYDLLITDMTMPLMRGDILANFIRVLRPDIPVIVCSGNDEYLEARSVAAFGVKFLQKPASRTEFIQTVAEVLRETEMFNQREEEVKAVRHIA